MTPEICRELFLRGAGSADLSLVEGTFDAPGMHLPAAQSRLSTLCEWLSLPRIGMLNVSQLQSCRLPPRPECLAGLLLDEVQDDSDYYRWQTCLESLWGIPVLGGLERLPRLRRAVKQLAFGQAPDGELCRQLGENFRRHADIKRLLRIAQAAPELEAAAALPKCTEGQDLRVAVAYDAAFNCYFPDTLDLLELCGATVINFSPLRDECLPPETDIVYLGCGHPERFASELAANCCMQSSLRTHICSGRRVYAEGGGLAYLCRSIIDHSGKCLPMAGVLPAMARLNPEPAQMTAMEATLSNGNWLAPAGGAVRGYLNTYWLIEPAGDLTLYLADPDRKCDLVGRHHAIGSRMHLNFAAQPAVFRSFFRPHAPSLNVAH